MVSDPIPSTTTTKSFSHSGRKASSNYESTTANSASGGTTVKPSPDDLTTENLFNPIEEYSNPEDPFNAGTDSYNFDRESSVADEDEDWLSAGTDSSVDANEWVTSFESEAFVHSTVDDVESEGLDENFTTLVRKCSYYSHNAESS